MDKDIKNPFDGLILVVKLDGVENLNYAKSVLGNIMEIIFVREQTIKPTAIPYEICITTESSEGFSGAIVQGENVNLLHENTDAMIKG